MAHRQTGARQRQPGHHTSSVCARNAVPMPLAVLRSATAYHAWRWPPSAGLAERDCASWGQRPGTPLRPQGCHRERPRRLPAVTLVPREQSGGGAGRPREGVRSLDDGDRRCAGARNHRPIQGYNLCRSSRGGEPHGTWPVQVRGMAWGRPATMTTPHGRRPKEA